MIRATVRRLALAGAVAGIGALTFAATPSPAAAQAYPYCAGPYYNPYYCYGYYPDYVWLGGGWGWHGGGHYRYGGYGGHFAGSGSRFAMAHTGGGHFSGGRSGGGHFGGRHRR